MPETISHLVPDIPFVDPSTRALLVDILSQLAAVKEEVSSLKDEVAELREEGRQKDERIAALEARLSEHEDFDASNMVEARQRLAALETPAPALSQKTAEVHLNALFSEMKRLNLRQTTTKDGARLMGISKDQAKKLKPYLVADMRFTLLKDPHHKQRYLIRLV